MQKFLQEVEDYETVLTCNGTPKVIDGEINCQYCEHEDCKHWKDYNNDTRDE